MPPAGRGLGVAHSHAGSGLLQSGLPGSGGEDGGTQAHHSAGEDSRQVGQAETERGRQRDDRDRDRPTGETGETGARREREKETDSLYIKLIIIYCRQITKVVWIKHFPEEPFDLDESKGKSPREFPNGLVSKIGYNIEEAALRQRDFYYQVRSEYSSSK